MRDEWEIGSHRPRAQGQALTWLMRRLSPDKWPQVQKGEVNSDTGIPLQYYVGEVPKLQRKSHIGQQHIRKADRSSQGRTVQLNARASSAVIHEWRYWRGIGDIRSGIVLYAKGDCTWRCGKHSGVGISRGQGCIGGGRRCYDQCNCDSDRNWDWNWKCKMSPCNQRLEQFSKSALGTPCAT